MDGKRSHTSTPSCRTPDVNCTLSVTHQMATTALKSTRSAVTHEALFCQRRVRQGGKVNVRASTSHRLCWLYGGIKSHSHFLEWFFFSNVHTTSHRSHSMTDGEARLQRSHEKLLTKKCQMVSCRPTLDLTAIRIRSRLRL